jgi:hypothetical protein
MGALYRGNLASEANPQSAINQVSVSYGGLDDRLDSRRLFMTCWIWVAPPRMKSPSRLSAFMCTFGQFYASQHQLRLPHGGCDIHSRHT